jgi:cold shock CspA family protein
VLPARRIIFYLPTRPLARRVGNTSSPIIQLVGGDSLKQTWSLKVNGKVKNYNSERKFGFIETPQGDVFFHISAVLFGLQIAVGDQVTFDIVPDAKSGRTKAVNVKRAERAA